MKRIIEEAIAANFDIVPVIVGLAIFLFGINLIGEQLKVIAGDRMKGLIDKYTTNPISGVFIGIIVTGLIMTSSGTTALTIGLVRAGLMKLRQAVAIIMGANIGTTITAILIGFDVGAIAPYMLLIGAFGVLFASKAKSSNFALLLFGFGSLFFGLDFMSEGLRALRELPVFTEFAVTLSENTFAAVMLGVVMTVMIQSSSGSIGIIQSLYAEGLLTLVAVIPILIGTNIGTTITAILASLGGNVTSKRAAASHVIFNLVGATIFLVFLGPFVSFVYWGTEVLALGDMMQIAFAHAAFNIITTLLLIGFINHIVKIVTVIIKAKPGEEEELEELEIVLEESIIRESPKLAITVAYKATEEMVLICQKIVEDTKQFIRIKDFNKASKVLIREDAVNKLNTSISEYLVEISSHQLEDNDSQSLHNLFYTIKDLERTADHCVNLVHHFTAVYEAKETLTNEALIDINAIFDKIDDSLERLILILDNPTIEDCDRIEANEDVIDYLENHAKDNYIARVKNKEVMGTMITARYIDILSDLERIGDHTYNIAHRTKKALNND